MKEELKRVIRDRIGTVTSDDLLCAIGLEKRRSGAGRVLEAVGLIGAGLVVGAGVALLFAPQAGTDTRREIGKRAAGIREKIVERAEQLGAGNGHTSTT